jgi:chromosomal replication initiation ATPase DnaA
LRPLIHPTLPLELPVRDMVDDIFLTSPCNSTAFQIITGWPNWPYCGAFLYGPEGSGKSHLAALWQQLLPEKAHCLLLGNGALPPVISLTSPLLLEWPRLPGAMVDEEWLFHALNHLQARQTPFLLLSRLSPAQVRVTLPDVRSRLFALTHAAIAMPDEQLIPLLIHKLLTQRQLLVTPDVIDFLSVRVERSYAAIHALISQIDQQLFLNKRRLTVPFLRAVLQEA